MMPTESEEHQQIIEVEVPEDQGLLFIKVVALPHLDAVEFDAAQAKTFALRILEAVERVEAQWK